MWGDAVLALVRGSGKLEYIDEQDDGHTAFCRVKRKGEPETTRTFSMDDAKSANLLGKQGPWSQYPKRMRQMRARAFALRDVFTDVLAGISIAEEVRDIVSEPSVPGEMSQSSGEAPETPTQQEPLDKEVGNMLMDHCHGDVAAMKEFVIKALEWPADTKLAGKWMQNIEEEELLIIKGRIKELNQPNLFEE
jgi:hypothetical protein